MTEKSRREPSLEDLMKQLSAAQDRAHRSGERAAQQFAKLLGTVHGGLGVASAAWLQRIFEHAHGPLSPLAWYLAIALFCVALGLVTLAMSSLLDQRSANHAARSTVANTTRAWHHLERKAIEGLEGNEKASRESLFIDVDQALRHEIESADRAANRINSISETLEICSWGLLFAAFVSIALGVIKTLFSLS